VIRVRQQKTGKDLMIPIHSGLAEILAARPVENLTFLVTEYGKPFTVAGFGGWFRRACDEAGLPDISAHGLRKAACRRLAEAGCTAHEITAVSGHASAEVARYTRAVDQERLARGAISRTEVSKPRSPRFQTNRKALKMR
jgi:integrase